MKNYLFVFIIIFNFMVCFYAHSKNSDKKNKSVDTLKEVTLNLAQKDQKNKLIESLNTLKNLTTNKDYSEHFKLVLHRAYKSDSKTILKHYCEHKDFKPLQKSRICKPVLHIKN
ncbi:MAG: hypothetical protein MK008_12055 [Bdellovibrionales bacterium]|nr:hypothetical protein [Bdellovibrionales bacterium]